MTKAKSSLSSKVLAILLVVAILISTVHPTVAQAVENASTNGEIVTLVNGGTVQDNKVTFSGTKLTWTKKNEAIGRNSDGWWVGIQVNAPEGMTAEQLKDSQYRYSSSKEAKSFWTYKDSKDDAENHNIQLWGMVKEEYLINAIAKNKMVEYKYEFDWNADGTYEQPITMAIDPTGITLVKDDIEVYPNYATVTPITSGTVNGNAKNLEVVIDDATLNWSDVDESVGRHTAGWWVGMKVTAPTGYTAEELQKASYSRKVSSSTSATGWSEPTSVKFWDVKDSADNDTVHHAQMWMVINPSLVNTYKELGKNISTSYEFDWNNDGNTDQTIMLSVDPNGNIVFNKDSAEFDVKDVDLTYGTKSHQIEIEEIKVDSAKYVYTIEGDNNIGAKVDENGIISFGDSTAKVGSITVKVRKEEGSTFASSEKTFKVNVAYHEAEKKPVVEGTKKEGTDWYSSIVTIKAPEGYKISASGNEFSTSDWAESVTINTSSVIKDKKVYLKRDTDGVMTNAIVLDTIKVDILEPTAKLTIKNTEEPIWEKIIDIVTFGIFKNADETMVIKAADDVSGIKTIQRCELNVKAGETEAEIQERLKNVSEWKELYTATEELGLKIDVEDTILKDNKNIIHCVKVVDYAQNVRYITSDGMIFDIKNPTPVLTGDKLVLPKKAATHTVPGTENDLFGIADVDEAGNIAFEVEVTEATVDGVLQSGIKSVSYEITAKAEDEENAPTEKGTLYAWNEPTLKTKYTGSIEVDATKFNYNDVDLTVTVVDNAGNETKETYSFGIDITAPTIEMNYDDENNKPSEYIGTDDNGDKRAYYKENRVVSITYTERNWNKEEANKMIAKAIKDMDGEYANYSITWNPSVTEGNVSDKNTYSATIEFAEKIHYSLEEFTYTDAAGNNAELKITGTEYPYVFSIDMKDEFDSKATIKFEKPEGIWETLLEKITFGGLFSKDVVNVTVEAKDDFAGIYEIAYIEKRYTNIKDQTVPVGTVEAYPEWSNEKEVKGERITEDKISEHDYTDEISNEPNKNVAIFVRVTDYAGNQEYYSSDGLIVDTKDPETMVAPSELPMKGEEIVYVPHTERPLYGQSAVGEDGVVTFNVNITEATVDGVLQSGIKSVSYEITAKDRADDEKYAATKEGTLYTWNEPTLKTHYTGSIEVDATKFNYNYVDLTVTVVDNAGNDITKTCNFGIDITAPTVEISYTDDGNPVGFDEEWGYYNCQRTAVITYTERSDNWDSAKAQEKMIEALNIKDEPVDSYTIKWIEESDEEKATHPSDHDKHIAEVSFTGDARYKIDLSYEDTAGNSVDVTVEEGTKHPFSFVIDTVKPELVDVVYEEQIGTEILDVLTFNWFRYFGDNATVKIIVQDQTAGLEKFDFEGILDEGVSLKNKAVEKTIIETIEQAQTNEEESKELTIVQQKGDKSLFIIEFKIPKEILTTENSFRGSLVVNAYDYCQNKSEPGVGENTQENTSYIPNTRLVVDKIAPKCQVTFDQPVNEVEGVSYYDKAFKATIVIDEANFYKEDVVINVNGQRVIPTDWTQTPGTDLWTSHVSFTEENDYILTVNYEDRSKNVMTPYESNQKTLDTTEPVISVSNIKHQSANNQETIGFTLTVTDKNLSLANVKPSVNAIIREGDNSSNYTYKTVAISLGTPTVSTNAKGETVYTYTVTNLEIDGYYSLVCTAVDHANHSVSNIGSTGANNNNVVVETVNFSVNRDGSVFWIETVHNDRYTDKTFNNELNGAYANDEVTVKLHEVNVDRVDELEAADKRTVLTLNDGSNSQSVKLVEKINGKGNYDRNVSIGNGGWYETIYTLGNDQFKKDGTYSMNIVTYDKADNSNVNTKSEEGTIKFVVDRTNPVVTTNVKSGQIIDAEKYTVEFTIAEVNLDESTIVVVVDGKEQKYEEVSANIYKFEVEDLLNDQFTIEVRDLAGNRAEEYKIKNLTVSAEWYIRWFANKPLFYGTIAGTLALAGCLIFIVVWKKRKNNEKA